MSSEPSPRPPAPQPAAIKSGKARIRAPEAAPGFCKRCKDAKATVSARQAVFCRPCFLDGCMVKFRDAVARFQLPSAAPGASETSAVLALSGGTCSRSLLHMVVSQYLPSPRPDSQQQQRQLHRGPFSSMRVLFIDESEVIPCDPAHMERIQAMAAEYGLELQIARLSDIFRLSNADLVLELTNGSMSTCARPSTSNTDLLQSIFTGTPSVSAKEDMLRTIRSRLLTSLAAERHDKYLLLGSCTLTLAHQVISATVKGRGAAVHDMVSPVERSSPTSSPTVLKPLSGFSIKELALFAHFHQLDLVPLPTLTSGRPPGLKQGIEQVTMTFLLTLEKAKEGTHSTVFKTAARLHPVETGAMCGACRVTPVVHGEAELIEGVAGYRGICKGCARTFKDLQMADKRGGIRAVRVPLFDEIAEYLLDSEGEE